MSRPKHAPVVLDAKPRYVYFVTRKATGEARYVGCSTDPKERLRRHRGSCVYDPTLDAVIVEGPFDPEAALRREAQAIYDLRPAGNRQGNPDVDRYAHRPDDSTPHRALVEAIEQPATRPNPYGRRRRGAAA